MVTCGVRYSPSFPCFVPVPGQALTKPREVDPGLKLKLGSEPDSIQSWCVHDATKVAWTARAGRVTSQVRGGGERMGRNTVNTLISCGVVRPFHPKTTRMEGQRMEGSPEQ